MVSGGQVSISSVRKGIKKKSFKIRILLAMI